MPGFGVRQQYPARRRLTKKPPNGLLLAGRLGSPENINSASLVVPIDNFELGRLVRVDGAPGATSDQWLDRNQFPALPVEFFQESGALVWMTIQYVNHLIFKS